MTLTDDRHLDGNAVAGVLYELFGREMSGQLGCCDHCGAVGPFGEVRVYLEAPSPVIRCPVCESVLFVLIHRSDGLRVGFGEIRWIETA